MIESILVLTGICIYAAVNHTFIAINRSVSTVHLLFAAACAVLVAYELLHMETYTARTVGELVPSVKWEISVILIFFGLFSWFVSKYTGIRPKGALEGLTLLAAVLLALNVIQPYSLQFETIHYVEQIPLPWKEAISHPVGQISSLFYLAVLFVLLAFGYAVYCIGVHHYRYRTRSTLAMLVAICLFALCAIEAILVRLAWIDMVSLGHISVLAMIIAMSFALSQEMQQKLRESEHRFRSLVEQSPFSLQVLSPDGHTLQSNHAWETLWGIRADEIKSYNGLQDKLPPYKAIAAYVEKGFAGLATEVKPVLYHPPKISANPKANRERWIRTFIYPIKDESGAAHEVVLMHEDITERKRAEMELIAAKEQAEKANQAKSDFLSRMSHELRTPLNAILGFAQLLNNDEYSSLGPNEKESVEQILEGSWHLLDLVNDLLDLASIEANKLELHTEVVDILERLQDSLNIVQPLAQQRDIALFPPTDTCTNLFVRADPLRLRQILLNLLSNAVKYNCQGGSVTLNCEHTDATVKINVTDTGPGIRDDDIPTIFEPFSKLYLKNTTREGAGIGLAIIKELVNRMDGRCGVTSQSGRGSTFWVELPRSLSGA